MLHVAPSLSDQVYDAIMEEICTGELAPGTHLVQEHLAARLGVSRQPVQQAMSRLKADGMVEEVGRRGLFVTSLDRSQMQAHYEIRATLDGLAAKRAAQRLALDAELKNSAKREGAAILQAGAEAVGEGHIGKQIDSDQAFHFLLYRLSGNPLLSNTAEPHWRFLRRAMGGVLRWVESPREIWRQHQQIFEAVLAGDAERAERLVIDHDEHAAIRLAAAISKSEQSES